MSDQPVIANRYQSDHLFLLVGTNPLPNFVAATLLLKPGGQLYLVHSQATQPVAERLARYWSEKEKRAQPQYVCVDEADGADVRRNIERVLMRYSKWECWVELYRRYENYVGSRLQNTLELPGVPPP